MNTNPNLAFINCNVIDGNMDSKIITDGVILVKNSAVNNEKKGVIEDVGNNKAIKIPPDYRKIDLQGKYVIPGLINAHAHLIGDGRPRDISTPKKQKRLIRFLGTALGKRIALKMMRRNVANALNSGVTTIRAVGDPHGYDLTIRKEVQEGKLSGPRIFAAGKLICPSGGHGTAMGRIADSPWEFRREVRNAIYSGADFIKIMSTGGVSDSTRIGQAGRPEMTLDEISAACDEAHRAGLKVASHVHSPVGIKEALRGGVDTIEHGAPLDGDLIEMFKNNPKSLLGYSALVPTLTVIINVSEYDIKHTRFSPIQYENAVIIKERMMSAFKDGLKGGVKIGIGTDSGVVLTPHYDVWKELVHFVEYGNISPRRAIYHATKCNAEILGIENETGTIEVGKSADFVILYKNPCDDLFVLSKPSMVVCLGNLLEKPTVKRVKKVDAILSEVKKN